MLAVIDSGGANLRSVAFALGRLEQEWVLTRDPALITGAERVLLPGVGAAGPVMQILRDAGLVEVIRGLTQPVLGICVGMQVLYERSEEGAECLGCMPGEVRRLKGGPRITVPHMGWNTLSLHHPEHPLLTGLCDGDAAFFVHSYAVDPDETTLASTLHGQPIAALTEHRNFLGCQFHPERSATVGHKILRNFVNEVQA